MFKKQNSGFGDRSPHACIPCFAKRKEVFIVFFFSLINLGTFSHPFLTGRCLEEREGMLTKEKEKERFVDLTHNS